MYSSVLPTIHTLFSGVLPTFFFLPIFICFLSLMVIQFGLKRLIHFLFLFFLNTSPYFRIYPFLYSSLLPKLELFTLTVHSYFPFPPSLKILLRRRFSRATLFIFLLFFSFPVQSSMGYHGFRTIPLEIQQHKCTVSFLTVKLEVRSEYSIPSVM